MKIIGPIVHVDVMQVKNAIREAGYNPAGVRKAIVSTNGKIDLFFHDGSKMVRIDALKSLIKKKK